MMELNLENMAREIAKEAVSVREWSPKERLNLLKMADDVIPIELEPVVDYFRHAIVGDPELCELAGLDYTTGPEDRDNSITTSVVDYFLRRQTLANQILESDLIDKYFS